MKYKIKVGYMYITNLSFDYDNEICVGFTNSIEDAHIYNDEDVNIFIEILRVLFNYQFDIITIDNNKIQP